MSIEIFYNIINVFTVTFNVSLINTIIQNTFEWSCSFFMHVNISKIS